MGKTAVSGCTCQGWLSKGPDIPRVCCAPPDPEGQRAAHVEAQEIPATGLLQPVRVERRSRQTGAEL